jgi:hypothetical protein
VKPNDLPIKTPNVPLPPRQELTPEQVEEFKSSWRAQFGWEPQDHDLRNQVSLRPALDRAKFLLGPGRPFKPRKAD